MGMQYKDSLDNSAGGLIQGKMYADVLTQFVAREVKSTQTKPGLAVVLVGNNPASAVYVRHKVKQAALVDMCSFEHTLPQDVDEATLLALIVELNNDDAIDGILVQLPLPNHIDEAHVLAAIAPSKDVDGFHPYNIGTLNALGRGIVPCTPLGCLMLLQAQGDIAGMNALVIGRSNIVGKPMAQLLLQQNATVTLAHSHTRNLPDLCKQADILVVAVGKPHFIQSNWVKAGAIVLDVGINVIGRDTQGKQLLQGDVEEGVSHYAKVSPVPGGVGPITVACVLHNTLLLHQRRTGVLKTNHYVLDERLLSHNWQNMLVEQ